MSTKKQVFIRYIKNLKNVKKRCICRILQYLGMLIEDRKIETHYKFEYSKSSFQNRNSISLFVFLRKSLHKQLETGHLVSAQMARRGVAAQRALSTVT